MALANGCLEYCSRLATLRKISSFTKPSVGKISVNNGFPYVSVPVLSKIAVLHVGRRSNTKGSLMIMPRRAARVIALITATGIAINKGQGVAITNTDKNRIGSLEN